MIRRTLPFALLLLAGCPPPYVNTVSDERRVWVVRQGTWHDPVVYRCADGAPVDQPPKPVCVRAPLGEQ